MRSRVHDNSAHTFPRDSNTQCLTKHTSPTPSAASSKPKPLNPEPAHAANPKLRICSLPARNPCVELLSRHEVLAGGLLVVYCRDLMKISGFWRIRNCSILHQLLTSSKLIYNCTTRVLEGATSTSFCEETRKRKGSYIMVMMVVRIRDSSHKKP